jgi:hypothetical protein
MRCFPSDSLVATADLGALAPASSFRNRCGTRSQQNCWPANANCVRVRTVERGDHLTRQHSPSIWWPVQPGSGSGGLHSVGKHRSPRWITWHPLSRKTFSPALAHLCWTALPGGNVSDLDRLSFGRDDAESDFAEGGLLRAGFLRTAAYEASLAGQKRLIIGRKGSGKSAICVTLAAYGADGNVVSLVTPDSTSLDEIRRFELQGLTGEMAKALFWRYMLEIQVAKYVVAHAKAAHNRAPRSVTKLQKFLKANHEIADPKLHGPFWKGIERLKTLSLGAFGASVSIEINAPSEGLRTSNRLNIVEQGIRQALADLGCPAGHEHMLLLVDEIEQVWSNDPESDAMVTGLLLAAKHVSKQLPGVRCVVFLRSDIYDALQFAEADKFHGDEMRIDWSAASLLDLLLIRARASLSREITSEQLWTETFPPLTAGTLTREYLIARTQLRPRDLIQFANVCRDTAKKNGHTAILVSDVREAELQYSQWKLQDLIREYKINYPFLAHLFATFQNSGYIVSRANLEKRMEPVRETLLENYAEYSSSFSLDNIVHILHGIGFLGVERKKRPAYAYADPVRIEPAECRFYIHPSLRLALGAESATDLHPYRPALVTSVIKQSALQHNLGRLAAEVVFRPDVSAERLRSITRAGDRITRQLEDPQLPPEVAREIYDRIQDMLRDTRTMQDHFVASRGDADVGSYLRWAIEFLSDLSRGLQEGSISDDREVLALARTLQDEARRLGEDGGAAPVLI